MSARRPAAESLRIVVLGYLVRGPLGGAAWHHLQYTLGLSRLGHDVYFVEDSDDYPSCYDPVQDCRGTDPSYGLRFAHDAFGGVGLGERWAYHDAHTQRWVGPSSDRVLDVCSSADLLIGFPGVSPLRPWFGEIPARALIDADPAFTQIRHLLDPAARAEAETYTSFFSYGENIASGRATVPDDGFPWQPTRQPLVPEAWPVTPGRPQGRFTCVMQWDSYEPREYAGRTYGMKSQSFGPYMELPQRSGRVFELALGSATAPRELLASKGWVVRDSRPPTRDPWSYQAYLRDSKAEFGVAKHGYVVSRCGWFSERSVSYLASGRPVVVQDTGFTDWLQTDVGVLAFTDAEEALAAIEAIDADYAAHCHAAREIAEEYFHGRKVLSRLVEAAIAR